MDSGDGYEVKDLSLADQGRKNLDWAESQMGALLKVRERFEQEKPLEGMRIGVALHPTKETGALVRTLRAGGAELAVCACNPLSTQDDVAAALADEGVNIWAYKGETRDDYYRYLTNVCESEPNYTLDDGCDLVSEIHNNHSHLVDSIVAGAEETTTGIIRLRAMEEDNALKYPMMAVNDLKTKHLFDNYLGTGQSTIDGILRASSILFAGKNVAVAGYGPCGSGIAVRAEGMGANVIVTEVEPIRALQAVTDGYRVMPMNDAVREADVIITVTGGKHVINKEHFSAMKDGAILANSGHFDIEIDLAGLEDVATKKETIRTAFDRYTLPSGKHVYVCGEGRLVNLAAAEGHPSIVMAQSFCGQALAAEYAVKHKDELKVGVNEIPEEIDTHIAELQLEALGVQKDTLTTEQREYLSSWQEGT